MHKKFSSAILIGTYFMINGVIGCSSPGTKPLSDMETLKLFYDDVDLVLDVASETPVTVEHAENKDLVKLPMQKEQCDEKNKFR